MAQGATGKKARIDDEESDASDEEFYTEGPPALLAARQRIAAYSLAHAKARVAAQAREARVPLADVAPCAARCSRRCAPTRASGRRSAARARFPWCASRRMRRFCDRQLVRAGRAVGRAERDAAADVRGARGRVSGVAWHPQATLSQSRAALNLATGGGDHTVCLWSLDSERPLRRLHGHEARIGRIAFHPLGAYVASASFDGTWRLWDVEHGTELLLQEGHSKEVYAVDFQSDGALVASGGLDAIGRVWDCRTGRSAMVLDGHAREILSVAFAPNAYQVATASGDDTVRIWDLRQLRSLYTIPAHRSSVADVRFFFDGAERTWAAGDDAPVRRSGMYLATAGYDGLVKLWSADDWQLLATLAGDAGKVMSVDISSDGRYLASGEWARTFKLWGQL
ncbi:hypothetical protein CBS14141_002370 [Malassezia furfur]|nr:hypothetical protein CBS14141_002370 [Malassezia furfur]